jgi:hypothetical protein
MVYPPEVPELQPGNLMERKVCRERDALAAPGEGDAQIASRLSRDLKGSGTAGDYPDLVWYSVCDVMGCDRSLCSLAGTT